MKTNGKEWSRNGKIERETMNQLIWTDGHPSPQVAMATWLGSITFGTSKLELRLLGNFSSQYEHMMLRGREVWLLT